MHPRYGTFRFLDFIPYWIMALCCIAVPLCWTFCSFSGDFLLVIPLLLFLCNEFALFQMATERFALGDHRITVRRMGCRREITVPENAVLVVSHADWISPFLENAGFLANNITLLKGKMAVSILANIPEETLDRELINMQTYTNTTIRWAFPEAFLYSVVLTGDVWEELRSWNCKSSSRKPCRGKSRSRKAMRRDSIRRRRIWHGSRNLSKSPIISLTRKKEHT